MMTASGSRGTELAHRHTVCADVPRLPQVF